MNHPINFFRVVFTFIIAFLHFRTISRTYLYSGYIVVEFFFIISGYFLYHSLIKKQLDSITFFKKRFKQFWLKTIIVGIILSLFDYKTILDSDLNDISQHFISILAILQSIIPFNDNINAVYPIWYLAVIIYGGGIIYAIIKNFPELSKVILPLLAFFCYAYLFIDSITIEQNKFLSSFLRGVGSLSIGCILYHLKSHIKMRVNLINILSLISVIVSTYILFQKNIHSIIPIICYLFIIWACFTKESLLYKLLNRNIFSKLSTISFEIFIGHMIVIKFVFFVSRHLLNNHSLQHLTSSEIWIISIIYCISLTVFAWFYQKVCNYLQKHLDRLLV